MKETNRLMTPINLRTRTKALLLSATIAAISNTAFAQDRFAYERPRALSPVPAATAFVDSVQSRSRLKYTLMGGGIGAFLGAIVSGVAVSAGGSQGCAQICRSNDEARYIIAGAAIGAGVGAVAGFTIAGHRAAFRVDVPFGFCRRRRDER